ncbi:MAG TPA: serine/threonine-protein kinase [Gemmatimonadaceae bacterium]|nr:serine/threonine-protein kinase [Gemmatimonadaceae bacterium]
MASEIPSGLRENLADRYALERLIARGGMAAVYLGRDLKHDRAVAVKVLRPELGALLGAERFLREIKLVARLQHPHILPLYDSGEADDTLYYVMPYVPGDSLRDRIRRERRLPLRDALRIAREVADALNYAHSNDIVHRDIKPENILLSGDHAMVADFGIARAVHVAGGERWETLTDSGVAVGTPAYMSPEQTAGDRDLDGRSDIFSLGCVVYEMLAGIPPFTGPDGEVMIAKRFTDPAPVLRLAREDVPESVDFAIQRALAREPAERFANALEFTDAIWDDTGAAMRRGMNLESGARAAEHRSGRGAVYQPAGGEGGRDGGGRGRVGGTAVGTHGADWKVAGMMAAGVAVLATLATLWIVRPRSSASTEDPAAAGSGAPAAAATVASASGDSAGRSTSPAHPAAGGSSAADSAGNEGSTSALPTPGVGKSVESPRSVAGEDRSAEPGTRSVPRRVTPEPQVKVPVPSTPRTDSVLASLRATAHEARNLAVNDGASQTDLLKGDSLERLAEASAAGGRVADAIAQLVNATTAWTDGARAARARDAQTALANESAAAAARRGTTARAVPESAAAAPSLADQRAAIGTVIASYGRAIEARDISAIKQVYPGVTATQQRDWQQFFGAVQNVKVSLAIAQLDMGGVTAEARVTGTYRYENTSTRRLEEQPVSFRASLRRDGASWRIAAIR